MITISEESGKNCTNESDNNEIFHAINTTKGHNTVKNSWLTLIFEHVRHYKAITLSYKYYEKSGKKCTGECTYKTRQKDDRHIDQTVRHQVNLCPSECFMLQDNTVHGYALTLDAYISSFEDDVYSKQSKPYLCMWKPCTLVH